MQLLRQHFGRIAIGAVLAALDYGLLLVGMPSQREQRIARQIRAWRNCRVRICGTGLAASIHRVRGAVVRKNQQRRIAIKDS